MTTDPLPIVFFSVVVKRAAVARSFPGGTDAFDRSFQPANSNDDMSTVTTMSWRDADCILGKLHAAGLTVGEDFGVMERWQGVLIPCHGIRSISRGGPGVFGDELFARLDENYRYQPKDVVFHWQPPEPPKPAPVNPPPLINGRPMTAHQYYQWRSLTSSEDDD